MYAWAPMLTVLSSRGFQIWAGSHLRHSALERSHRLSGDIDTRAKQPCHWDALLDLSCIRKAEGAGLYFLRVIRWTGGTHSSEYSRIAVASRWCCSFVILANVEVFGKLAACI